MRARTSTGDNLLRAIYSLIWGDCQYDKETLRHALLTHLKQMDRGSGRAVSRQAINNWIDQTTENIVRAQSRAFLYDYISKNVTETPENRDLYRRTTTFLTSHPGVINEIYPGAKEALLRHIIDASNSSPKNILNDLFFTSPLGESDATDQSYYVTFRYSTTNQTIVKTFMVCRQPQLGESNQFIFVQFFHNGEYGPEDLYRESYGIILKLEKSYYWLGSNYIIPADKERVSTQTYQSARMTARERPVGIELLAAEHDEIALDRGLFSGVTMTIAGMRQPVMARVALLHLGTTKSLGEFLRDDIVMPTELSIDALAADLVEMVNRMQQHGCKGFGRTLDRYIRQPEWDKTGSKQLVERILGMIDNSPAITVGAGIRAPGAIETYSKLRGSRPRI